MEAVEQVNEQQVSSKQIVPQMSVGNWIITIILLAIPIVNFIMLFIWAFDATSERRNFARAYLIIFGIVLALWILLAVLMLFLGMSSGIFTNLSYVHLF
jgi:membrane protein YdbS with pleckstrin-like domain